VSHDTTASATVRVGVAGWDYADWKGIVYPDRPGGRFDRLAWIARFIDVVEINSTFYRPAAVPSARSWLRRTEDRPRFAFSAKAHRSWTHEAAAPPTAAIDATLAGLAPLREAGRLRALLLQFPQSFHFDDGARARLELLADRARGWPLVVEVRHTSWSDEEAGAWLAARGLGWCAVDQPRVGRTTIAVVDRVVGGLAYLRLHGRNAAAWFDPDAGRDRRYDYLYTRKQLEPLAAVARRLAGRADELVIVQNNHFRGQALVNALQLRHLVEGRLPAAPGSLVDAYPQLARDVRVERDSLF